MTSITEYNFKELTDKNLSSVLQEEIGLYILKFSSKTCGPCATMKPVFDALAKQNPSLPFYNVQVDEQPHVANYFNIRGVPTTIFIENGQPIYGLSGITPLRDLQYIINNINDPHFRETGDFLREEPKPDYTFRIILIAVILVFLSLFIFL